MTSGKRENKITLSHILSIKPDQKRSIDYNTLILNMIWEGGWFSDSNSGQTTRTGVSAAPGEEEHWLAQETHH